MIDRIRAARWDGPSRGGIHLANWERASSWPPRHGVGAIAIDRGGCPLFSLRDLSLSAAINAPRVMLNDRDYLLGAFSAAAVIVGPTKPWVATEFVYIADYPPPRRAALSGGVARDVQPPSDGPNRQVLPRQLHESLYGRPCERSGGQFTTGDDRGTRRHRVCSSTAKRQRRRATRRPVGLSHERS